MFSNKIANSQNNESKDIIATLLKSELEVSVNSIEETRSIKIKDLIRQAKDNNKALVFTFTPGPFATKEEMPDKWMETPAAVGCTPQLNAFQNEAKDLNADVYAINKHSDAYQCGNFGLLAVKKLSNLKMISDGNGVLEKEFGLKTFKVGDKDYLARFSIVIKPNGQGAVMEISSPVNDVKAKEHVEAIKKFIQPALRNNANFTRPTSASF